MKRIVLALVLIFSVGSVVAQQKIAHVNSQKLLDTLPSRKAAIVQLKAFEESGLAIWLGQLMTEFGGLSLFLLLLLLIAAINFLTEITSNLATTAMLLPVLAPMALEIDVHPFGLMVGAAIAASCAYMLPVATPPNAVVFGSGYLRIPDMVSKGVVMNIFSVILISLMVYFLLPIIWDIDLNLFPPSLLP